MNMDQTESTHRVTAQYADALLNRDERRLVDMTNPRGGAAGKSSDSNVTKFSQSGAQSLLRTIATDDCGIALFASKSSRGKPIGAAIFEIIDGQVQGDWVYASV